VKRLWKPVRATSADDQSAGLQYQTSITVNGFATQAMETPAGGALMVAFALHMGAYSTLIGALAAIPYLGNPVQLPASAWIARSGRRRDVALRVGDGDVGVRQDAMHCHRQLTADHLPLLVIVGPAAQGKQQCAIAEATEERLRFGVAQLAREIDSMKALE